MGRCLLNGRFLRPNDFRLGNHCHIREPQLKAKHGPGCQLLGQEELEAAEGCVHRVAHNAPRRRPLPPNDAPDRPLHREPGMAMGFARKNSAPER